VIRPAPAGTVLYNLVGHTYVVISGGPWLYQVQPLTPGPGGLVPLGGPVRMSFSEIDAQRLAEEFRS
jgi:hypothetical protein